MDCKAQEQVTKTQLLFVSTFALTLLLGMALAYVYSFFAHPKVVDVSFILPKYRSSVRPEPEERFIFLMLILVIPVLVFWACVAWFREGAQKQRGISVSVFVAVTSTLFLILPFLGFDFSAPRLFGSIPNFEKSIVELLILFASTFAWYRWRTNQHFRQTQHKYINALIWIIFAFVLFLQIASWRVIGINSIRSDRLWVSSLDAVLYTVSQAVGGQTLLSDIPSQYGLYPEILAPLFKLIGLSVLSFSVVCAVMQWLSMTAVMYVLHKTVRDPVVKVFAGLVLIMVTFETCLWLIGVGERYFQYWPVRFFWPALTVLLFHYYLRSETFRRAALVSLACAIGLIWNIDTGLVLELAFVGWIVAKWMVFFTVEKTKYSSQRKNLVVVLVQHVLVGLAVVAGMAFYIQLSSTQTVHWSWLIEYQKAFYKSGFMMLPMSLKSPVWATVLGSYLIAMVVSLTGLVRHPKSRALDIILFMSILGVGIFSYYQGRSHILNLITVSWPAVIVSAMLADRTIRAVGARMVNRASLLLSSAALSIFIFCSIPLIISVPTLYDQGTAMFQTRNTPADDVVQDELSFIRAHSHRGEKCLILSLRQSVYYAEAGLVSPIKGPGYMETVLESDMMNKVSQIRNKKFSCVFEGIGKSSAVGLVGHKSEALANYSIVATNRLGTMRLLRSN